MGSTGWGDTALALGSTELGGSHQKLFLYTLTPSLSLSPIFCLLFWGVFSLGSEWGGQKAPGAQREVDKERYAPPPAPRVGASLSGFEDLGPAAAASSQMQWEEAGSHLNCPGQGQIWSPCGDLG